MKYRFQREDKKLIAGYHIWDSSTLTYWTADWQNFFLNDGDLPMRKEDLEYFISTLESPLNWNSARFVIKLNREIPMRKTPAPKWKCYYKVNGDGFESGLYGFGNTEEEALANCKKRLEYMFKLYGKKEDK